MRSLLAALLLCACYTQAQVPVSPPPVRLILDTDIGNDIDDALALATIHALANRAEVQLLAVTISKDNEYCAPYVDLVNTFYGRPDIPIGVVRHGKTPERAPMVELPATRRDVRGNFLYPHRLVSGAQAPEAVELLTRILNSQPDGSVTIAQIGFSTNLARLLQSHAGRELIQRKVKVLCLMAGNFAKPQPEFNVYTDPESAAFVFRNWPTPMIFSGFEIGLAIRFPYRVLDTDFRYAQHHPIVDAFKIYVPKPENHPTWDATAVVEAIRPDAGYFTLSAPGVVAVGPKSTTVFTPDQHGRCRYLIANLEQTVRVQQLLVDLVSEPPYR
ncbi:MAG TPA: nucleoside hydrolase [Bryobacteraceae bacterium]|nr:nucleoside hydrolase [Bryobacteraceae bacterium]